MRVYVWSVHLSTQKRAHPLLERTHTHTHTHIKHTTSWTAHPRPSLTASAHDLCTFTYPSPSAVSGCLRNPPPPPPIPPAFCYSRAEQLQALAPLSFRYSLRKCGALQISSLSTYIYIQINIYIYIYKYMKLWLDLQKCKYTMFQVFCLTQ